MEKANPSFSVVRKILLLGVLLTIALTQSLAQIKKPVKWQFIAETVSDSEVLLKATAKIDKDWHVFSQYMDKGGPQQTEFTFRDTEDFTRTGKINETGAVEKSYDTTFMVNVAWYEHTVTFTQKVKLHVASTTIEGEVLFMACTKQECLLPETIPFKLEVSVAKPEPKKKVNDKSKIDNKTGKNQKTDFKDSSGSKDESESENRTLELQTKTLDSANKTLVFAYVNNEANTQIDSSSVVDNQDVVSTNTANVSLLSIFLVGFLGGLAAFVMPCIFPMVPLTISYFTKRASQSRRKTVRQVIIYGVSIVIIYVAIGLLVTITFGSDALNNLATNGVFNLFFFVLLVVFAASLFGAFEITLPSSWVNTVDKQSDRAGLAGIFFMAATLALVSFSCTGPIIGGLLVQAATMGSYLGPAVGMLGFSGALALIFVSCALFPSLLTRLPKSGGWLNSVKITLGFLELALALKFLSNVDLAYHWEWFDREVFLVVWIIIFGVLGIYLLGKLHMRGDSEVKHISPGRLFFAMSTLAFSIYMVPGLWGAPLKAISAFLPPQHTQDFDLYTQRVGTSTSSVGEGRGEPRYIKYANLFHAPLNLPVFFDYQEAVAYARATKKPIMIDFTGHACVNCRKMETVVWSDIRILNRLKFDYVVVQLYVDDKTELPEKEQFISTYSGKEIKTLGNKWSDFQAAVYNTNSQPYYVLLDSDERLLTYPQGAEYDIELFKQFLDTGLQKFNQRTD